MLKKGLKVLLALLMLVGTFAPPVVQASYDEDMAELSTDVVRAEIISSRVEEVEFEGHNHPYIYTFYVIRILEVFQGDLQVGEEIEMAQIGGELGNMVMINSDEIPIEEGEDLVLFLLTYPGYPAGFFQQGVYQLDEEVGSEEEIDTSIELIPVVPEREIGDEFEVLIEFEVSVEDLWELEED